MNVIKEIGSNRRLVEVIDTVYSIEDLAGDMFNPEVNPDIDPLVLERGYEEFIKRIDSEGVFGYVLEEWNPAVGKGWEQVDSIYGFIGEDFFSSGYEKELGEV